MGSATWNTRFSILTVSIHNFDIYGVHNGHISNDDFLFEKWQFSRQAEADRKVILHVLADVSLISALSSIVKEKLPSDRLSLFNNYCLS